MLDHGPATAASICCWSQALGKLPPDAPHHAILTGFPFFDSESGADDELAVELQAFLDDGPPPLVFTLGSFAVASAGRFYDEAAALSRAVGRRAVLLTGQLGPPHRDGDCLIMNYAPHSAVFPRASAIVHHGGIGTIGQALRAGRPQIVVPHFGDQFDNAARLEASGVSATIHRDRFKADQATSIVSHILTDPVMANAARRATTIIAREDGAAKAALHIAALAVTSPLANG